MNKLPTLSVKQLNTYLRLLIEGDTNLRYISVKGEISNFTHHRSGHMYMTLKDSESSVKAVMFRGNAMKVNFQPKDGMTVIATGGISVFERDGLYQFYIDSMVPVGVGGEYLKFIQLRDKLEKLGYFDESRKRPLPAFPENIGLITSATGAAVRDVLAVLSRRYPQGRVMFYPCTVQGPTAAQSVIKGIRYFNAHKNADVIIVTRGGGSSEDLSAFNDEELAKAAFESDIPIISAVGHEIDYTILDFTADMRVPTPSAAAERVSPDNQNLKEELYYYTDRITRAVNAALRDRRMSLELLERRCSPSAFIESKRTVVEGLYIRTLTALRRNVDSKKAELGRLSAKTSALSPLDTLARGYASVTKDGSPVTTVSEVSEADKLTLTLKDGKVYCHAEKVSR